jgi:hypothetical protein
MMSFSPGTIDALIALVELKLDDLDESDRVQLRLYQVALIELEIGRGRPSASCGDSIARH